MVGRDSCEYCGKENVLINSTPEVGGYCKECLKLTINNCREAIKEINEYEKLNKVRKTKVNKMTNEYLKELEIKKEDALSKLMSGEVYINYESK
jgi:hypothetical protein